MMQVKHELHIENDVLGTIMYFEEYNHPKVRDALLKLSDNCFYNICNRKIFGLIKDLFDKKKSFGFVDILTLLPNNDDALHNHLGWLIDSFDKLHFSDRQFGSYVDKLVDMRHWNKQIKLSATLTSNIQSCSNYEEAQDLLIDSMRAMSSVASHKKISGTTSADMADAYFSGKIKKEIRVPTTCNLLNKALSGGLVPKSLVVIAAGASVGKTGFAIYLADCIARAQPDTETLFFSLEMECRNIWMRHVGICAGKSFDWLDDKEMLTAISKSMESPLEIYDTATTHECSDIDFICNTARLTAIKKKVSVIVVDYLGLVDVKTRFERNDLKQSYITGKLAQLAIELDCIVIALSQINRNAALRSTDDRCPWPHDAADSSGGHRSSTLWIGVDRPELYRDESDFANQFVVKCRKNRFGDTFELVYAFNQGTFGHYTYPRGYKPFAKKQPKPEQEKIEEQAF